MMTSLRITMLAAIAAGACALFAGCKSDSDTPKYKVVKGQVTGINSETGEVQLTYYDEKLKKDVTGTGKLASDAEILIDGATAKPEDVHKDDRVTVKLRIEKKDNIPQYVATQVDVTRNDSRAVAGSRPATTRAGS